jgi:hypothetical protein
MTGVEEVEDMTGIEGMSGMKVMTGIKGMKNGVSERRTMHRPVLGLRLRLHDTPQPGLRKA